ncbi:hypothetical protein PISMIDRAFT_496590 [Pisolithus microcarpus 441]|uniref:Uncharacterized protein n=1 Tax=Pisolithus microcarpus 441 TaxID=765257 RepID=A0A0C9YCW3_9AGAM|nr:hypothetical protein PISMIDRAFT_496590 [Pisolithus microcarpus 441]
MYLSMRDTPEQQQCSTPCYFRLSSADSRKYRCVPIMVSFAVQRFHNIFELRQALAQRFTGNSRDWTAGRDDTDVGRHSELVTKCLRKGFEMPRHRHIAIC